VSISYSIWLFIRKFKPNCQAKCRDAEKVLALQRKWGKCDLWFWVVNKEFDSKWYSDWVTRWKTWNSVWFRQKKEINLLSKASRPAMGPSHILIRGVCGKLFFWGKSGWGVNLATHLHLTPRATKSETKPSRCHIPLLLALGQLNFHFILKATFLFGTRFYY